MTRYEVLQPECDISGFLGGHHGWPTVVAIRNGELIGAISTGDYDDAVVCSILKVVIPNPVIVAAKLVDAYEKYLVSIGVKSYIFSVNEYRTSWIRTLEDFGLKRIGRLDEDLDGNIWFQRILNKRSWAQSLRRIREKAA